MICFLVKTWILMICHSLHMQTPYLWCGVYKRKNLTEGRGIQTRRNINFHMYSNNLSYPSKCHWKLIDAHVGLTINFTLDLTAA